MRVIFFGTAAFAVPSLERLAERSHTVVLCVTQPDRPQGRGLAPAPAPVKRAARRLGIPLAQPERLEAGILKGVQAEIGVVAAYGQLIRRDALSLPALGMVGIHPSLLPKYRGAAPVAWALLNGDRTTGITIFRLNERLDAGGIILQQAVPIQPQEDAGTLAARLARLGAAALLQALDAIAEGRAVTRPQDESQASEAPKLTKAQGRIDWTASAEAIERLVRATVPWPGATTTWSGTPLKIWRAAVGGIRPGEAAAGCVVRVDAAGIAVATGDGTVLIQEVQLSGKRRTRAQDFLAGHPMHVGDKLGDSCNV